MAIAWYWNTPWAKFVFLKRPGRRNRKAIWCSRGTLLVGAAKQPLHLTLGDDRIRAHVLESESARGAEVQKREGRTVLRFPPSDVPRTVKVLLAGESLPEKAFHAVARASGPAEDVQQLTKPGPQRWPETVTTAGELGQPDGAFALDTITLPLDNPYNSLMFLGGHAFLPNGDAAVTTVYGDVWLVAGIDDNLDRLVWKRFATGLYQPLGIRVIDEKIFVTCRDQIAILHDYNQDGEVDHVENFNNDAMVSWNSHEFVTNLERDREGNLYCIKSDTGGISDHDGCVLKITPDGSELSVYATGFRNSNGLTVGPDDTMTVSPQEGDWTPGSCIAFVEPGKFYGHRGAHHQATEPTDYEKPLCWIPRTADNSSGGHAWVTSDRWGPMKGQLLHLSAGQCRMLMVLQERTDELHQGGTVPFDMEFDASVMRARFSPFDGQLYVSGMRSWVSRAAQDGCFHRVRYTGEPVYFPKRVDTYKNGLAISFYEPLDKQFAESVDSYKVRRWNYKWTDEYGSLHYHVHQPDEVGEDDVRVRSATMLDDRTVFLELEDMLPVNQLTIDYQLRALDQTKLRRSIYYTIHKLPEREIERARLNLPTQQGLQRDDPGLASGLIFRFSSNEGGTRGADARVSRMAAMAVAAGQAITPFIDSRPFHITADGFVHAEWPGEYDIRIESVGEASVELNGQQVTGSGRVTLRGGMNEFELNYSSPAKGDAFVRVLWDSELFPEEPIPPTALYHVKDDVELSMGGELRHGRDLFTDLQCGNCHAVPAASDITAPALKGITSRLNPDWIAAWLLDPHSLNSRSRMPKLFDPDRSEDRQKVSDLVAYLSKVGEALAVEPLPVVGSEQVSLGEALYEDLGCIACHQLQENPTEREESDRIPLAGITAKFRSGQLVRYLQEPHEHHRTSRMPDLRLTRAEAVAVAAYLEEELPVRKIDLPNLTGGDATRGQRLFVDASCIQCHAVPQVDRSRDKLGRDKLGRDKLGRDKLGRDELVGPRLASVFGKAPSGCIAERVESGLPDYRLDMAERRALASFLAHATGSSLENDCAIEVAETLISELRCAACHSRDHLQAALPLIAAEEGRGAISEFAPSLTWAGDKLHGDWMEAFIGGKSTTSPRPWLRGRMPSFPHFAPALARGLVAQHGAVHAERVSVDSDLAAIGEKLVGEAGGLNCQQCHAANVRFQDNQDNIAPAIQFRFAKQRLRHEHYLRLVMDPPRYEPRTRMPKLSLDGQTTGLRNVFDGDARQQFEAIWHYIQSQ